MSYGMVVGGLFLIQRNLIYLPDTTRPDPALYHLPEMRVVELIAEDGVRLLSWYRPALAHERPVIVYFHGNGGHLGYRAFKLRPYLDAGYGVLLLSWRGYSGNGGKPTESGLYADGRAALSFVRGEGVPSRRQVLYGESLGTGIAVELAMEQAESGDPVGAVVLESPFTSLSDLAAYHYPWLPVRWLIHDRYDSIDKIAAINAPLFVVHGEADRIIPVTHGKKLIIAAQEPKKAHFIDYGGHNNLYDFGVAQAVIDFISRLFP